MASHSTHRCLRTIARLALMIIMTGAVISSAGLAQTTKSSGKAASVFDDEKKTDDKKSCREEGSRPRPTATRLDSIRRTLRPR